MRALIAKEWRENRALVLGFLVLAPLLSLGLKWLLSDRNPAALAGASVLYFLPAMLGLYLFAIASDLVAAETASGRIAFLAALPVRPAKVWAAKALFLYGGATLYLGWLIAVECALLPLFGGSGRALAGPEAAAQQVWLLYLATGAAAVLFTSTLLDRGFAAALAGLLLLGGLGLAVATLGRQVDLFRILRPGKEIFLVAVALVGNAFLLGSFLAFTGGRIHIGCRIRRTAFAFGAFLLVALPPAVHAEARLRAWNVPSPSDGNVWLQVLGVSPDRRFVAVLASRYGPAPYGDWQMGASPRLWAVPTDGGAVRVIGPWTALDGFEPEGHVALLVTGELVDGRSFEIVRRVDLETGEILSTRSRAPEPPPAPRVPVAAVRMPPKPDRGWWTCLVEPTDPAGTILGIRQWSIGGRTHQALVPIDRETRAPGTPLVSGPSRGTAGPPGGDRLLVLFVEGAWIVDRRDGSARPVPDLADVRSIRWIGPDGRFFAEVGDRRVLGRLDGEGRIAVEAEGAFPGLTGYPWFLDGEIALATGPRNDTLDLVTRDGQVRRLLPAKED